MPSPPSRVRSVQAYMTSFMYTEYWVEGCQGGVLRRGLPHVLQAAHAHAQLQQQLGAGAAAHAQAPGGGGGSSRGCADPTLMPFLALAAAGQGLVAARGAGGSLGSGSMAGVAMPPGQAAEVRGVCRCMLRCMPRCVLQESGLGHAPRPQGPRLPGQDEPAPQACLCSRAACTRCTHLQQRTRSSALTAPARRAALRPRPCYAPCGARRQTPMHCTRWRATAGRARKRQGGWAQGAQRALGGGHVPRAQRCSCSQCPHLCWACISTPAHIMITCRKEYF